MSYAVCVAPTKGASSAVTLAARELIRWLSAACPKAKFRQTRSRNRADFLLGTFEDLAELAGPKACNDAWIDEVVVRSADERLILAGSNPRSVLFAVYTYLDKLGFAWIVPGRDGEIVPRLKEIPLGGFDIRHRASLIYRGFAPAGAFDAKSGIEFVEWMARNRFNHLFFEGSSKRGSYQRALGHPVPRGEARRWDRRIIRAAKQRGLIFESMGHGWTSRALGWAPGKGRTGQFRLSSRHRAMACMIEGKRRTTANAHICLSNPEAQRRMVSIVREHAVSHPEIDVLAVWMADGFNNWCECPSCAKVHPSDLWARQVNRIAREVYRVRPDLKIEMLGYSVLMEPPPTERIDNSRGNVILMYAPFLRCYLHSLDDPNCRSEKPLRRFPPVNKLHHPMNAEYFGFFRGWRKKFGGTNYVFDYYCWLPIKRDFFEGNVPETICRDLKAYPAHGINGCVDCSRVQSFWPTPLARWLQARSSWDASVGYARERRTLLELTFGDCAGLADEYLKLAYRCLLPARHGREEERAFSPAKVRQFKRCLPPLRRKLRREIDSSRGRKKRFLRRLDLHAEFTLLHLNSLLAEAAGRYGSAIELARKMRKLSGQNARWLAGAADGPELDWLEASTIKRLQEKQAGTYRRID